MTALGASWSPSFANEINNAGQIVGQNSNPFTYDIGHATSWQGGVATDLGTLGGGPDVVDYGSSANGVNDLGVVVGWSTISSVEYGIPSPVHAVLWSASGESIDLGTLPYQGIHLAPQ
jgi:probable HAF family extracellular repeat protein